MTQAEKISLNSLLKEKYLKDTGLKHLTEINIISSKAHIYLKLLEERARFESLFFYEVFRKLYSNPKKFHKYFNIRVINLEPLSTKKYFYNRKTLTFSFNINLINRPEEIPIVISELAEELDDIRQSIQLHFIDFGGTISQSGEIGRGFDKKSRFTGLVQNLKQNMSENDFQDIFRYTPNSYKFQEILSEKLIFHKALKISTDSSNIGDLKILLFMKKMIYLMYDLEKSIGTSNWPQKICIPLIVGHGTDTVERTSNYIHWFFSLCKSGYNVKYRGAIRKFFDKGIDFKIIFVTAHTPHGLPNSDAYENLKDALKFSGRLLNKIVLPGIFDTILIASGKIIAFFSKGITDLFATKKRDIIFDSPIPQIAHGIKRVSVTGKCLKTFNLKTLPEKFDLKLKIPDPETDCSEIFIPSSFAYVEHHMIQYTPNEYVEDIFLRLIKVQRKKKTALLIEGELNKVQIKIIKKYIKYRIPIFILCRTKNCKKWLQSELESKIIHLFSYIVNGENLANRIRFFYSFFDKCNNSKLIDIIRGTFGDEKESEVDKNYKSYKGEKPNFPVIHVKVFQNFTSKMIEDAGVYLEGFKCKSRAVVYEGYGDGHIPLEDFPFSALIKNYFQKKFKLKLSIPNENLYEIFFYLHELGFEKSQIMHYLREIISRSSKKLSAIYDIKKNYIRQFMTVKPRNAYASLEKYAIGQLLYFMGLESPGIGFEDNDFFMQSLIELYAEKIPRLMKEFNDLNLKLFREKINYFLYNIPIRILLYEDIRNITYIFKLLHLNRNLKGTKMTVLGVEIQFNDIDQMGSFMETSNLLKYIDCIKTYFGVTKLQLKKSCISSGFFKNLSFPYEYNGQFYPDYFIYLKCCENPFENRGIKIGCNEEFFVV